MRGDGNSEGNHLAAGGRGSEITGVLMASGEVTANVVKASESTPQEIKSGSIFGTLCQLLRIKRRVTHFSTIIWSLLKTETCLLLRPVASQ